MLRSKSVLITLALFLSLNVLNAQEENNKNKQVYWLLDHPAEVSNTHTNSIDLSVSLPFDADYFDHNLFCATKYTYSNLYTKASLGFQLSKQDFNFFIDDTFWFMKAYNSQDDLIPFNKTGVKTFFNLETTKNLVAYYNFAFGVDTVFNLRNNITFSAEVLFDFTKGIVELDSTSTFSYLYWDFLLSGIIDYKLPVSADVHVFAQMTNFTPYKLNRFYAPIFVFGSKYDTHKHFAVSGQLELHYLDLFCYSRYFDFAAFTISGEFKL